MEMIIFGHPFSLVNAHITCFNHNARSSKQMSKTHCIPAERQEMNVQICTFSFMLKVVNSKSRREWKKRGHQDNWWIIVSPLYISLFSFPTPHWCNYVSPSIGQACASFLRFSMIITSFVLSRLTKHLGSHPAGSSWITMKQKTNGLVSWTSVLYMAIKKAYNIGVKKTMLPKLITWTT